LIAGEIVVVVARGYDLANRPNTTEVFSTDSDIEEAAAHRGGNGRGIAQLVSIMRAFGLTTAETGSLFGVRRRAVNMWLVTGVPQSRLADVVQVAEVAAALRRFFRPERVPAIVRGPIPALEERSILDTIATRGTEPIFKLIDGMRSWIPPSESSGEASQS
jgi:hypothetical protein